MDVETDRASLSDQLRRAIDASGMSRYAVAKAVGLDQSVLSRFMAGKSGLSLRNLDRLGALLNLRITAGEPAAKAEGR